jgi:hypothetical protein
MKRTFIAKPEHEVAYQDIVQLVRKHADKLTPAELLAVAANMLGKLMAMQDQRTMTPGRAMEIVADNIECGNQELLDQLMQSRGSA